MAWTTIFIVVFLFPGILFHIGLYALDRIPREIVRVGVIGDVAVAIFVSILVHLIAWTAFARLGVSPETYLAPLADLDETPRQDWVAAIAKSGFPLGAYALGSAAAGLLAGLFAAWIGMFATHKWARDLRSPNVLVTAYVMTKTVVADKVLMYRGGVTEFYLKADGSISYVVLNDVRKFHMQAVDDGWTMADPKAVFGETADPAGKLWSFLAIDGGNVSNILFERSPAVKVTDDGVEALNKALEDLTRVMQGATPQKPDPA